MEDQWYLLTEDIAYIDYTVDSFEFSIDVGWYPQAEVMPSSFFRTIIIEGPVTDGGVFFRRKSNTLAGLRNDLKDAVDLIQKFKTLSKNEILRMQLSDSEL